jgi:hypothetical protein
MPPFARKKSAVAKEVANVLTPKEKLLVSSNQSKNVECPLTYEIIKYNDMFYSCQECKWNFNKDFLDEYFKKQTQSEFNCPICRTEWSTLQVYVNKSTKLETKYVLTRMFGGHV